MSLSSTDPDSTALFAAIRAGKPDDVAAMLRRRPDLVRAQDPDGQLAIHAAAECNDPVIGALLIAHGADPDATFGNSAHTAMSWAVTCNAPEFARMLVTLGRTPDLFCAAGMGSLDAVRAHFDASGALRPAASKTGSSRYATDGTRLVCPPETPREQLSDALYIACRNAHADVVRFLLTKHPDLTFKAYNGATALHWAHFGGSPAIVEMLDAAGADAGALDDALGCTPRVFGVSTLANWGFAAILKRRLDADPSLATAFDGHTSPLHQAARGGNVPCAKLLLDRGANPALQDERGKTPIQIAVERRDEAMRATLEGRSPMG